MTPFHATLDLIYGIGSWETYEKIKTDDTDFAGWTTADLARLYMVDSRTIKRYIGEAREMGAEIYSEKRKGVYIWRMKNWSEILENGTLGKWLEFECEKAKGITLC